MIDSRILNFNSKSRSSRLLSHAFVAVVLALASGTACTQAPVKPQVTCANIDWFEMGRSDGTYGLPFAKIQEHQARCNGTPNPVDFDVYTNGRNLGLIEYCTATVGAQVAKEDRPYEGVCPAHMEKQFLSGYELGRRIKVLEKEHDTVASRMQELTDRLGNPRTQTPSTNQLRSELDQLQKRRSQIDSEIDTLEGLTL